MKAPTLLSLAALVTSVAAIILHFTAPKAPDAAEIETMVNAALAKKEHAFVMKHTPAFKAMFAELEVDGRPKEWDPKTIDELFEPLIKILTEMGNIPDEPGTR